jgi:peptidoglycan/LPS O-acetylase OafA/YrhL
MSVLKTQSFKSLASSVFRRPFRLLLPLIGVMILQKSVTPFFNEDYDRKMTAKSLYEFIFVPINFLIFGGAWWRSIIPGPAWTLQVEWSGSLTIYLLTSVNLLVQNSQTSKYLILFTVLVLNFMWNRWDTYFIFGLILAEASQSGLVAKIKRWRWIGIFQYVFLLFSIFLFAKSDYSYGEAVQSFLAAYITTKDGTSTHSLPFWDFRHGTFLLCCPIMIFLEVNEPLQRFLSLRIPTYLGRISFSLYLLHDSYFHTVGQGIFKWLGGYDVVSKNLFLHLLIPSLIYIPLSELFTRYFELPSVALIRKLEKFLIDNDMDSWFSGESSNASVGTAYTSIEPQGFGA